MPEVAVLIILVNFRRADDTVDCVNSLCDLTHSNWACVVQDNNSMDGSFDSICRKLRRDDDWVNWATIPDVVEEVLVGDLKGEAGLRHPRIAIVKGPENRGFAAGNNAALRIANTLNWPQTDFVWFLNNDTVVLPDTLTQLIERMSKADAVDIGMCGASMLHYGTDRMVQCLGGAIYSPWFGLLTELGAGMPLPVNIDGVAIERQLDYVSGASMFVRRAFLDAVGPMSERYFLYCEELDWATRGRKHGFRLGYAPGAIVWHREGAVLGSGKAVKRGPLAEFYGLRSRLRYTAEHFPVALPLIWLTGCAQVAKRVLGRRWRLAAALVRALSFRSTP